MMRTLNILLISLAIAMAGLSCKPGGSNTSGSLQEESDVDPEPSYRNGVTVLDSGADSGRTDYEKAYGFFQRACEIATPHQVGDDPETARMSKDLRKPEYFYNAGWTASRMGHMADAEDYYMRALDADDAYTPALVNLAYLYAESGRPGKAADIYLQYLSAHPVDVSMMLNLAGALGESGDLEGAEEWIQKVLFEDPENDMAYKVLARAYYQMGEYDMAILLNEMASAIKEEDSEIRNTMGLTYLRLDEEVAASDQFEKAIEMDPNNLEANLNLGYLALESGNYQQAAECFNAVIASFPGDVDAHIGLAVAYRGIADFDSAIVEYDTILSIDPCDKLALRNKAAVQAELLKKYKEALKTLDGFVECHGAAEVDGQIATIAGMEDDRIRQENEAERIRIEREQRIAEAKAESAKLQLLIDRAYLVFELYGERADAIDFSFNQALDFYVMQAEDAIGLGDDPDFIRACAGYLDTFIIDEYLRALDENEKLDDWDRPREDLWNDPEALKAEKVRREGGGDVPPAEGGAEPAPAEGGEEPVPAEGSPAEETPAEEAPAEEVPADEASVEEAPAEEAPAEEAPAEEAPVEEAPIEEPAVETPAE